MKQNVVAVLTRLDKSIPVIWDRYTVSDDGFYVVYGWIMRSDGQRDFILISMMESDPIDQVFYTTSSAKYSRSIMCALYGSADDHSDCRLIGELFSESVSISLPNGE